MCSGTRRLGTWSNRTGLSRFEPATDRDRRGPRPARTAFFVNRALPTSQRRIRRLLSTGLEHGAQGCGTWRPFKIRLDPQDARPPILPAAQIPVAAEPAVSAPQAATAPTGPALIAPNPQTPPPQGSRIQRDLSSAGESATDRAGPPVRSWRTRCPFRPSPSRRRLRERQLIANRSSPRRPASSSQ